ncbi:MAG: hypothetical protein F6K50_38485 [Moorea sp. SIO3I7]|nr:hypothetical protein [Moorena sp. SIO3I7]
MPRYYFEMRNVRLNPILLLRIGIGFNIALRAMALATGNRQKLTAIAFAAYINLKHLNA